MHTRRGSAPTGALQGSDQFFSCAALHAVRVEIWILLYLGAVAALALWVGIWCYFDPARSDAGIPWRLPPLCATLLGAMYFSGAVFNGTCMCARRWADVRVIMPMIAMWTGGLAIISVFYLSAFDFSRTQVLTWFAAYTIYPSIALVLMWVHRQERGVYSLDAPVLPAWVRRYLLAQGGVMVAVGLALLVAPETMLRLWPWGTGRMMLQLYAAPLLSYGIGSFILRRQHTWPEIRLALIAMAVFVGLELAASIRYRAFLNGPTFAVTIWLGWLAITTAVLVALSWMAYQPTATRRTGTSPPIAPEHRSVRYRGHL